MGAREITGGGATGADGNTDGGAGVTTADGNDGAVDVTTVGGNDGAGGVTERADFAAPEFPNADGSVAEGITGPALVVGALMRRVVVVTAGLTTTGAAGVTVYEVAGTFTGGGSKTTVRELVADLAAGVSNTSAIRPFRFTID